MVRPDLVIIGHYILEDAETNCNGVVDKEALNIPDIYIVENVYNCSEM